LEIIVVGDGYCITVENGKSFDLLRHPWERGKIDDQCLGQFLDAVYRQVVR
jgi:hypothetical protein